MKTPRPRLSPRAGQVFVLIAPGYDEVIVSTCISRMREHGISVSVIGLSSGPIPGAHGLRISADLTLEEASSAATPRLVIMPGRGPCATALSADPRVTALLKEVTREGGGLAAANNGYLESEGERGVAELVLGQGQLTGEQFVEGLIRRLDRVPAEWQTG